MKKKKKRKNIFIAFLFFLKTQMPFQSFF